MFGKAKTEEGQEGTEKRSAFSGPAGQLLGYLGVFVHCWWSPWHSKMTRKKSVLVLQSSSGTRSFLNHCLGEVMKKTKTAILVRSSEIAT